MSGYEKLARLMAKDSEVATFQRFDFLNTLNILYLQAELVHLEQDLRDSMKEDLESGNNAPSQTPSKTRSVVDVRDAEGIERALSSDLEEAGKVTEKRLVSQIEDRCVSLCWEVHSDPDAVFVYIRRLWTDTDVMLRTQFRAESAAPNYIVSRDELVRKVDESPDLVFLYMLHLRAERKALLRIEFLDYEIISP